LVDIFSKPEGALRQQDYIVKTFKKFERISPLSGNWLEDAD